MGKLFIPTIAAKEALTKYGANYAGCWFDGGRGIYLGEAVIETAIANGYTIAFADEWKGTPIPTCCSDSYATWEHYHELTNAAEDYMQQFAAVGYYFGSNESGDWGLWESEEE